MVNSIAIRQKMTKQLGCDVVEAYKIIRSTQDPNAFTSLYAAYLKKFGTIYYPQQWTLPAVAGTKLFCFSSRKLMFAVVPDDQDLQAWKCFVPISGLIQCDDDFRIASLNAEAIAAYWLDNHRAIIDKCTATGTILVDRVWLDAKIPGVRPTGKT